MHAQFQNGQDLFFAVASNLDLGSA